MPHTHTDNKGNEILVVTYDELVPRFFRSENYLRKKVSADQKRGYGIRKVRPGKGTESYALLDFDSLPLRIREQMEDPRADQHVLEQFYTMDREALRYFRTYQFETGEKIPAENQEEYIINANVINAIIKLRDKRIETMLTTGKRPKHVWELVSEDVKSFNDVLEKRGETRHTLPSSWQRLKEKVELYENATGDKKYENLISGYHISNSIHGARKVDEKSWRLFESMFTKLGYKPNYVDVHKLYMQFLSGRKSIICPDTGEMFNPSEFSAISDSTIRLYLTKWQSKNATLRLRMGDRQKMMGKLKPYHSMKNPETAGCIISVDDRQPPFEYSKGSRVWFYLAYDIGAHCYTTIVWGKTKEGLIKDFYRQMVRNYSEWGLCLPAELECESSLNSTFRDTLLKEGNMFRYVRIEANNARGKYIENANKQMRYGAEKKMEGWIARPFARSEANQVGVNVPILPYEDIVEQVLREYEDFNNSPHPVDETKTRWEFFVEKQHPELDPINWHGIIPYIGYETKTSCNAGIIELNGGECLLGNDGKISTGEELINLMKLIEGEDITVRWLDGNDGNILKAYAYVGDTFICELLQKPLYHRARIEQTEEDEKNREIMSKYVATIEGYGNRLKKQIDPITIIDNQQPRTIMNGSFKIPELHRNEMPALVNDGPVEILQEKDDDSVLDFSYSEGSSYFDKF